MDLARTLALVIFALIAACTGPQRAHPSLAPRAAEAIDPRVPVEPPVAARVAGFGLTARLQQLVRQAREGDAVFRAAAEGAERLAGSAGARESESWIAAQQALSAAVAARAPTTRALGDIDALGSSAITARGGLAPADLAALQAAAAEVAGIDRRQASRIGAIQRRLGS